MLQQNINGATAKPTETSFQGALMEGIMPDANAGQGVIPSVAIDKILAHRQSGLTALEQAMALLIEAKAQFDAAGCGHVGGYSFAPMVEKAVQSCDSAEKWPKIVKREVDREIWQKLMHDSGMYTLMNSDQRDKWQTSLYSDEMPEATLDNVLASFKGLHASANSMVEEGIISLFRKLSWDYKTNNPRKFGKKIIKDGFVSVDRWGVSVTTHAMTRLDDLEKAFCLLDKKSVPDFRDGTGYAFREFASSHKLDGDVFESIYFTVRYFKKGSAHITFVNPELVDKMNDVLARHYPGALPAA